MKKMMICAALFVAAIAMTACSTCTCTTTTGGNSVTTKVSKDDMKTAGINKCSDLNYNIAGVEQKCH